MDALRNPGVVEYLEVGHYFVSNHYAWCFASSPRHNHIISLKKLIGPGCRSQVELEKDYNLGIHPELW